VNTPLWVATDVVRGNSMRRPFMLAALVGLIGCKSLGGPARKGTEGTCDSDRQCLYGLVCRGAAVGLSGERRCVYERYSHCADTVQCMPGRTCRAGFCEAQCVVDTDCKKVSAPDAGTAPLRCVVGECKADEHEQSCLVPADCAANEDCVAGRCEEAMERRCLRDSDCNAGSGCASGRCQ
jgi:hypothetical protein